MRRLLFLLLAFELVLPLSASAQEKVGSWWAGLTDDNSPYLLTINDSGTFLGKWCEESGCYWMVVSEIKCDQGTEAAVLLNSESGAFASTLTCSTPRTVSGKLLWRSIIHNSAAIDDVVRKDSKLGLAVAMADGSFRVLRFSLDGSAAALKRWESLVAVWLKRPNRTKDMTL